MHAYSRQLCEVLLSLTGIEGGGEALGRALLGEIGTIDSHEAVVGVGCANPGSYDNENFGLGTGSFSTGLSTRHLTGIRGGGTH